MRSALVTAALVLSLGMVVTASAQDSATPNELLPAPSAPYSWSPDRLDDPANVAIFRDNLPWDSTVDDQILTNNAIAFTVFGSADIGVVDLAAFDKVIISNQQNLAFNNAVIANAGWFENFVAAGGCLLLGMAHYVDDLPIGAALPGGFSFAGNMGNDIVTIMQPGHAIFTSPNYIPAGDLNGWNFSSHGDINVPVGSTVLLQNAETTQGPAAAEAPFGLGYILATAQPYQWASWNTDYAENLLLYNPCGEVAAESKTLGAVKSLFK